MPGGMPGSMQGMMQMMMADMMRQGGGGGKGERVEVTQGPNG